MRLKLDQLQRVVKRVISEEKSTESLRHEVTRVLGPIMDTDVRLEELAEAVNDRVAVLERTGRESRLGEFKPSALVGFISHDNVEVRRMCARLLPERFILRMTTDRNREVRSTVARRLPVRAVREMVRRFPGDEELRRIYAKKRLAEAHEDEQHRMYDEKRLGDAVKQSDVPGLSEEWYRTQADLFMQDYGQDMYETTGQAIDYNWEEMAVRNFCRHSKATSGVEIDEARLLKAVQDIVKEREDAVLRNESTGDLKELARRLREEHDADLITEAPTMLCLSEEVDQVEELVASRVSPATYLERVEDIFSVQFARIPPALMKYRMGEGLQDQLIPLKARLPHAGAPRVIDEKALDLYVEHWNEKRALAGEPIRIAWNPDPGQLGVIGFEAILR